MALRGAVAIALVAACVLLAVPTAFAQAPADDTRVSSALVLVGEQATLTLDVVTPAGATIEPDPANASWNGIEIVRLQSLDTTIGGDTAVHRMELVVAGFTPGERPFQPAVFVVEGTEASGRLLPVVALNIVSSLAPGDPLELSPVAPPAAIDGAESPLLRPAIVLGGMVALAIVALGVAWLVRRVVIRTRRASPAPAASPPVDLDGAEALLDRDPVAAYRTLAATIRHVLGDRYGFPARALTTHEMDRRMQDAGVDRWQARLVTGLLEECDAVVYAGYRPAPERRHADLNMAREIVGAG